MVANVVVVEDVVVEDVVVVVVSGVLEVHAATTIAITVSTTRSLGRNRDLITELAPLRRARRGADAHQALLAPSSIATVTIYANDQAGR